MKRTSERKEMKRTRKFLQDESGASAVEYGLLIALIAVVCIAAIEAFGTNLVALFTTVTNAISSGS